MRVAIVTDSTADIPTEMAEKHNIHVVPAILVVNGKSLEDGKGLSREEFYAQMPTMVFPPTTATPSAGTFETLFERLFTQGFQTIISIHVGSLLSGIVSTAQLAAKSFGDQIKIVDSQQLSLGLGFQVIEAAESAHNGYSVDAILARIQSVQQRLRVVAMLDTLEYIRRSGRVSWARARIGSILRIKPFVEIKEGQVLSLGQTRTRKKGVEYLKSLLNQCGEVEKLAILHTNAVADANQFHQGLAPSPTKPPFVVNVTTIVGTHIGPNALGFAAVVK